MILGNEGSQVSVVFGPAVEAIRSAEALAKPGDIILSPKAWQLYDGQNLIVEVLKDERAVKVGLKPHHTNRLSELFFFYSLLLYTLYT